MATQILKIKNLTFINLKAGFNTVYKLSNRTSNNVEKKNFH